MNNDRELLELAAKAAGIFEQGEWFDNYDVDSNGVDRVFCQSFVVGNTEWNPLTDDGDALRLAVKLNIPIWECAQYNRAMAEVRYGAASCEYWEPVGDDPYAATRRAIVRAAAEIGRTM